MLGASCCPFHPRPCQDEPDDCVTSAAPPLPVTFFVPLRFRTETCPSRALLEPRSRTARRDKRCCCDALPSGRVAHWGPATDKHASHVHVKQGQFHRSILLVPFSNEQFFCVRVTWSKNTNRTVCQVLMVQSCGGPGHLRLVPDNEYDEDG